MKALGLLAFIVTTVGLGVGLAFQPARAGTASFWAILMLPTVALAGLAAVRAWHDGVLAMWMRPTWGDFSRGFAVALLLFGGTHVFVRVVSPPGDPRQAWLARLYLQLGDPETLREHVPLVVACLVVFALAEELLWRGLVAELLAERFGSRWAWIGSAVLYFVAHAPAMWTLADEKAGPNPLLPVAALGAGLVWGGATRYFGGRLIPAVVSHALFGWSVVMMFRLWGPSV